MLRSGDVLSVSNVQRLHHLDAETGPSPVEPCSTFELLTIRFGLAMVHDGKGINGIVGQPCLAINIMTCQNLALFPFDNLANIATSSDGWCLEAGVLVDALAGDDTITGISTGDVGIDNEGEGTINTGKGDDTITGISFRDFGISNDGKINTGEGDDTITGISALDDGIDNDVKINTGEGDDTITGISARDLGIDNEGEGTINTGKGDDTITGISTRELGISNDGKINTGKGDDLVNALEGGFGGIGNTYLGDNNDTLMGFGTGSFYGGSGSDKVLFGEGTYTIRGLIITSDGVTMSVNEFENIGGAYGGLFAFKDGTLTVDSKGVGTFA